MSKKKILIVSPKFHPVEDGLGQYTKWFYLYLKKYANVSVLTSLENQISSSEKDFEQIHNVMEGWKFPKLLNFPPSPNEKANSNSR